MCSYISNLTLSRPYTCILLHIQTMYSARNERTLYFWAIVVVPMEDVEIWQIRTIVDHRSCPKIEEFSAMTRTNSYRNIKAHRYRWSTKSGLFRPSWIVSYSFMCIFAPCRRHAALLEAWILGNLTRPRLAEPWAAFPSVSLTRPFARSRRFDPSLLTIRSWIALLFVQVSHLPETKSLSFFGLHFRIVNANYHNIDYYASLLKRFTKKRYAYLRYRTRVWDWYRS